MKEAHTFTTDPGTLRGLTCERAKSTTLEECGSPAITHVVGGCVHEHITHGYLCGEHRAGR